MPTPLATKTQLQFDERPHSPLMCLAHSEKVGCVGNRHSVARQTVARSPSVQGMALMNGSTLSKAFVSLPGGAAAVYTSSGLTYYRHTDWLGSGRLATTPVTRTAYFDVAYGPYGEGYASSGSPDLDFTGQAQDTVSGLYDFLYREYNANHGRWPWPDSAGLGAVSIANPQTWNRYAYVGNMPLNNVDNLGLISNHIDCNAGCRAHGYTYSALSLLTLFQSSGPQTKTYDTEYVPPSMTDSINADGLYSVTETTGYWRVTGATLSDAAPSISIDWGYWAEFGKNFVRNVVHGRREKGQTLGNCMSQNVTDTTFGAVNPDKLADPLVGQVEFSAAVLASARGGGFSISGAIRPVSIGTQLLRWGTGALGLSGSSRVAAVVVGSAALKATAVAGAATAGLAVGAAVNCR